MSTLTFVDTHNMVAFLDKPAESDGFHKIIDFLNANQICYALTVNPTIYTSCIQQFWATTKAKTVNGVRQIQALIDKKKLIITETSIRSDLHLEDAGDLGIHVDSLQTPIPTQPSSSRSQKKQSKRKQRKDTRVTQEDPQQDDSVPTPSNDPSLSGEDSMQLSELMLLCTNLKKQRNDLMKHNMFDIDDLHSDEVNVDMPVGDNQEQGVKERDVDISVEDNLARNLQAQLEAKIIEEEKLARKQEEETNIALIESWDNTQAMMEVDFKLAQRLQTEEQGEITIEERSRLFVELMNKRKKHFAMLRAEEKRRKPPTKAQKRNQMSTYLKNMVKKGTEESSKGAEDELEADKSKKTESSKEKAKGSRKKMLGRKRAGKEQQQESLKKQRMKDDKETDEVEEVEEDDEAELKKHLVIVKDDEIAIDAIPLATNPPMIVEYKLLKEGIMVDPTKEFLSLKFSMKDMGEADVILVSTPMATSEKLIPNNGQAVSQLDYSRVIGCLMYVMTCTRPNIDFAVGKLSRYTSNYGTQHWQAIQRAFKKKTCITGSTIESEFVALAAAGKEVEWLRNLILEISLWSKPIAPISIRYDSVATLAKAYSQMYNGKSRHLGVRHTLYLGIIMNREGAWTMALKTLLDMDTWLV
ncbi:hypothetical protein Tco_0934196 [Tanacetum coccineum]